MMTIANNRQIMEDHVMTDNDFYRKERRSVIKSILSTVATSMGKTILHYATEAGVNGLLSLLKPQSRKTPQLLKELVRTTNLMQKEIHRQHHSIQQIRDKQTTNIDVVNYLFRSGSVSRRMRHFARRKNKLITLIDRETLEQRIQCQTLLDGRLPISIYNIVSQQALPNLREQLRKQNLYTEILNMKYIYRQQMLILHATERMTQIAFEIPTSLQPNQAVMNLYNFYSIPIQETNTFKFFQDWVQLELNSANLAISTNGRFYRLPDLNKCTLEQNIYSCKDQSVILPTTKNHCLLSLFNGNNATIRELCIFSYFQLKHKHTFTVALTRDTYLLSTNDLNKSWNYICRDQSVIKLYKPCIFCLIHLGCRCSLISEDIILANTLFLCRKNVSVDISTVDLINQTKSLLKIPFWFNENLEVESLIENSIKSDKYDMKSLMPNLESNKLYLTPYEQDKDTFTMNDVMRDQYLVLVIFLFLCTIGAMTPLTVYMAWKYYLIYNLVENLMTKVEAVSKPVTNYKVQCLFSMTEYLKLCLLIFILISIRKILCILWNLIKSYLLTRQISLSLLPLTETKDLILVVQTLRSEIYIKVLPLVNSIGTYMVNQENLLENCFCKDYWLHSVVHVQWNAKLIMNGKEINLPNYISINKLQALKLKKILKAESKDYSLLIKHGGYFHVVKIHDKDYIPRSDLEITNLKRHMPNLDQTSLNHKFHTLQTNHNPSIATSSSLNHNFHTLQPITNSPILTEQISN